MGEQKLDQMTYEIANNINKNIVKPQNGGTIGGFGYHSLGNLENNCVGASNPGYQYFTRAMKLFMASYNLDYENPQANLNFSSQSNINDSELTKIFAIPNSNNQTNIPNTEEYNKYYSNDYYNKYVKVLMQTNVYKSLDLSENKNYNIPNSNLVCSYADIPNSGSEMMPLDINKIDEWYNANLTTGNQTDDAQRLASIKEWFKENEQTINIRKTFNLENQLEKIKWEENNSIIKVALNAPTISLLDKSFNESAFDGLILYWKSKGVTIKKP